MSAPDVVPLRLVLSTFASEENAAAVVRVLVEEHLAACGTVLPGARSIYRWKDAVEDTPETVVLFKTTAAAEAAFRRRLAELHPYETPEIVTLTPADVAPAYAAWVAAQVAAPR